jgi:hypothetical protein
MSLPKINSWLLTCCLAVITIGLGLYFSAQFPDEYEEAMKVDSAPYMENFSKTPETVLSRMPNISTELLSIRNANLAQTEALEILKQQIALIQKQQQLLNEKLYRLEKGEGARHVKAVGYEPPDDGLTEEQRIENYKHQHIAVVEAQLRAEKVDLAWQAEMEADVTTSMRTINLEGSHLTNIQCANSLCKLSLNHNNQETLEEFMQKISSIKPWNTDAHVDTQQHGLSYTTIIYLARAGKSLPKPERFQ